MLRNNDTFTRFCYIFIFLWVVIALFPFVYIFVVSVSDSTSIAAGKIISAENTLSLASYKGLLLYAELGNSLFNSIVLSLTGTVLNMMFTIPCAYAISRKETRAKNIIYGILLLAMFFRGEIIPTYIWMSKLKLLDSYFAIWLSKLVSIYNILILGKFFESLPQEAINAAKLDGAGPLTILCKIAIPMSKGALLSISILYLASWWNDYYFTLVFIRSPHKYTLPVRIIQMITNIEDSSVYCVQDSVYAKLSACGVRAAGIVVSILPMLITIPLLQRNSSSLIKINKKKEKIS